MAIVRQISIIRVISRLALILSFGGTSIPNCSLRDIYGILVILLDTPIPMWAKLDSIDRSMYPLM